jgi:hypothetical protein
LNNGWWEDEETADVGSVVLEMGDLSELSRGNGVSLILKLLIN